MRHAAHANRFASKVKGWSVNINPMRKHGSFSRSAQRPEEGTRPKQSTPGGGLRLHGNSFTRDLSPSLRKPSVGVFGIDEKHVQLSQPSLELR